MNRYAFFTFFLTTFLLLGGKAVGQNGSISLAAGEDTLLACAGDLLPVAATSSGFTHPVTISWSDGSTGDTAFVSVLPGSQWLIATATDATNASATDSVLIHGTTECVYPGDANGDGYANNLDVLTLGHSFAHLGPARPNAHLQWIGQPAHAWGQTLSNGVDFVHSDVDGNGGVNAADLIGISLNYLTPQTATNSNTSAGNNGVPIFVDFPTGNVYPGDTIYAPVMLGTATMPADSIYGIALSIQYDPLLIEEGSVQVDFSQSWLGTEGQDMVALYQDFYGDAQVDLGLTRTNQQVRNGFGQIATIIVTVDDIAGKTSGIESVSFGIDHVALADKAGQFLPVAPKTNQLLIALSNDDGVDLPPAQVVRAFPNPSSTTITVEMEANTSEGLTSWQLVNMQGQTVWSQGGDRRLSDFTISVSDLPAGMYLLRGSGTAGTWTQRVQVE